MAKTSRQVGPRPRSSGFLHGVSRLFRAALPQRRSAAPGAAPPVEREAQHNVQLLSVIARANNRLVARGRDGGEPWARLMDDTYDHVCRECQARRSGAATPDDYLDALAEDPDIRTICDERQRLREALDQYRRHVRELIRSDPAHEALEREIREVVLPGRTPVELQTALSAALAKARKVVP